MARRLNRTPDYISQHNPQPPVIVGDVPWADFTKPSTLATSALAMVGKHGSTGRPQRTSLRPCGRRENAPGSNGNLDLQNR